MIPCVYSAAALRCRPALYSALPSSLNRSDAEAGSGCAAAAGTAAAAMPPPAAGASLCAIAGRLLRAAVRAVGVAGRTGGRWSALECKGAVNSEL